MAQVYDPEVGQYLKGVVEAIEGPLTTKLVEGMQNTAEVAKESGIPNFIKACDNAIPHAEEMAKLFGALIEECRNYIKLGEKMDAVLGQ